MPQTAEWSQLLANSATEYCYLIEHLDQVNGDWLDNLSSLLPRIHAAVSAIADDHINFCPCDPDMDLDLRFDLYTRLRKLLGDHDGYVLDFDKPEELEDMSGSLADDFTDIYFELKKGLELLGSDPNALTRAVDVWYGGYLWHWGQHLVDAERHLYDLQVHRRLGGNSLIV
jgi:hypothetical protein